MFIFYEVSGQVTYPPGIDTEAGCNPIQPHGMRLFSVPVNATHEMMIVDWTLTTCLSYDIDTLIPGWAKCKDNLSINNMKTQRSLHVHRR